MDSAVSVAKELTNLGASEFLGFSFAAIAVYALFVLINRLCSINWLETVQKEVELCRDLAEIQSSEDEQSKEDKRAILALKHDINSRIQSAVKSKTLLQVFLNNFVITISMLIAIVFILAKDIASLQNFGELFAALEGKAGLFLAALTLAFASDSVILFLFRVLPKLLKSSFRKKQVDQAVEGNLEGEEGGSSKDPS